MGWILRRFTVVFSFKESSVVKSDESVSGVVGCSFCPASAKQHVCMLKPNDNLFRFESVFVLWCSISQSAGSES